MKFNHTLYLFSFFVLSLLLFSCGNNKTNTAGRTHYNWYKLKGKVKSFTIFEKTPEGFLVETSNIKFDRNGLTTETSNKDRLQLFKYNEQGDEVAYQKFENGVLVEKYSQADSLDHHGRVIKYTYDNKGTLREKNLILYGKDSLQEKNNRTIYNKDGKIISELRLNKGKISRKEAYEYDTLGNLTRFISMNDDTTHYKESLIKYNKEGIKTDSIFRYFSPYGEENDL